MSSQLGIIVFTSTWCAACPMYKAILQAANIEYTEIDADKHAESAHMYGVKQLPTTVIKRHGYEPVVIGGAVSADVVLHEVARIMANDRPPIERWE